MLEDSTKELLLRLEFSIATGQSLEGFRIVEEPETSIDGKRDLPAVLVHMPSVAETYQARHVAHTILRASFTVTTARSKGLAEHLKNTRLVLNAIELDRGTPRQVDPGLKGTCAKPFAVEAAENSPLDNSLNTRITLVMQLRPALRGQR